MDILQEKGAFLCKRETPGKKHEAQGNRASNRGKVDLFLLLFVCLFLFFLPIILQCYCRRGKEEFFTFCLNGRQEQGRAQDGERC